tara:strand:- start:9134 stop:10324 length:1191 start_codon:yes stop_codon:yes gene_type:complete
MLNKSSSEKVWTRKRALTMIALIGCISIYGITSSLLTPLLSLILESRGVSSTFIGGLAMAAPTGLIIGAFTVSRVMRNFGGRSILLFGVALEIALIFALMKTQSLLVWFVIRFMGGVSDSLLFVVTETWIVEITPSKHRGRVMGFYNSILMMSFALGPLTLSLSGTKGFLPFLICIALLSLAGLPLLLTGSYVPSTIDKPRFGVFSFAFVAPLLAMACFVVAFQDLSITSLMPVYGLRIGMTESNATLMLFFGISGGALLQFPIGWAADHFDPRKVLIACAFAGLIGAAIWPFTAYSPYLLWATLFLWWGLFSGVTTVAMILAGNWFRGSELATAMAAFGVFWGMGAFVGPLTSGAIMDLWNPYGLPLTLIIVAGIFFLITLFPRFYRLPQSREFS